MDFGWFWNANGHWYEFWSGFGSCLTEFAIVGIVWRKLNCHTKGCYRIGHHHVDGTPYTVCRKHHPDVPNAGATVEHIHGSRPKLINQEPGADKPV